jgi:hypothetical protein
VLRQFLEALVGAIDHAVEEGRRVRHVDRDRKAQFRRRLPYRLKPGVIRFDVSSLPIGQFDTQRLRKLDAASAQLCAVSDALFGAMCEVFFVNPFQIDPEEVREAPRISVSVQRHLLFEAAVPEPVQIHDQPDAEPVHRLDDGCRVPRALQVAVGVDDRKPRRHPLSLRHLQPGDWAKLVQRDHLHRSLSIDSRTRTVRSASSEILPQPNPATTLRA